MAIVYNDFSIRNIGWALILLIRTRLWCYFVRKMAKNSRHNYPVWHRSALIKNVGPQTRLLTALKNDCHVFAASDLLKQHVLSLGSENDKIRGSVWNRVGKIYPSPSAWLRRAKPSFSVSPALDLTSY